jgi:hypothetical protein
MAHGRNIAPGALNDNEPWDTRAMFRFTIRDVLWLS